MPNFTENYNLKKPLQEEFYNIDDHNGNMDIIDAELKKRATLDDDGKVLEEQLPEYVKKEEMGKPHGVASLDEDGKVPKEQLPESASGGGSGKRTVRFTVGSSQYGWTASDCDYLCDGTADDVKINAAIQALRSTGGEIVLLDGLYNLASAILINKDGVTLTGNGVNTKIIRAFSDDENDETLQGLFIVTGTYCTIKNLYIDDVKGNYTAYRAISLYGGSNCIIADNTIVNIGGDGIYVNSDNNTIDNNNVSSSGNSGINLNKTNKSIVTNNKVSGSNMYGIFAIRVSDGVISNNVCTENYNSGISLYWADRTAITGNASNNNDDCGFYITRGSGNIICGNTFVGNGAYGVTIQLYASNTVVMSNNFKDNASGDVNDKGENNTIHLPYHEHEEYGKYSQHCWLKAGCAVPIYSTTTITESTQIYLVSSAVASAMQIADSYNIVIDPADGTPKYSLVNPRTFTWSTGNGAPANSQDVTDSQNAIDKMSDMLTYITGKARPFYILPSSSAIYKEMIEVTSSAQFTASAPSSASALSVIYHKKHSATVTYDESTVGTEELIYTDSANSYTEGEDGKGYKYTYLGIPSETLPLNILQTGSYMGTGGAAHTMLAQITPASIVFNKLPKVVIIVAPYSENSTSYRTPIRVIPVNQLTATPKSLGVSTSGAYTQTFYAKVNGNTLYWYGLQSGSASNFESVFNDRNVEYYWYAIG